jgi:hypothetical protein
VSPSTAYRRMLSRWRTRRRAVSRVSIWGPRFVGGAEALVEAEVEMKRTEEEWTRERDLIDRGRAREDLPAQKEETVAEDKAPVHA